MMTPTPRKDATVSAIVTGAVFILLALIVIAGFAKLAPVP